ncbi:Cyclin, N-terminal domain [Nesidiocoris tenuis]|uniref:Cyclin-Q n=1 Tax=Nesidiocoris tenuis TaxID=355587 RepID=A0ABN7B2T6_9HEMI|nr:Cyclin, N-terminal domain [Nesidiocoris tenuis]
MSNSYFDEGSGYSTGGQQNSDRSNTNLIEIPSLDELRYKSRRVDYKNYNTPFWGARFVYECGYKLKAHPITIATAASLFHQFFREFDPNIYDRYLIGSTCLYIAGKMQDEPYKLRDVINVAHATVHRGSSPLDLKEEYWMRRESIVQAELLIMRGLKFQIQTPTTHKYMLHYLMTLRSWLPKTIWDSTPLCQASFSFLQDFYHDPAILDYKPQLVAIACIFLAIQCYGVEIPGARDSDDSSWYDVFSKERKEDVWNVVELIMDNYNHEISY